MWNNEQLTANLTMTNSTNIAMGVYPSLFQMVHRYEGVHSCIVKRSHDVYILSPKHTL